MSVTEHTPISTATGDGVSLAAGFAFPVLDEADLKVKVAGVLLTLNVDYTVAGVGNPAGGTVTFTVAPANGAAISLYRESVLQRETDYQTAGDFRAETVNPDFDRLWLVLMETLFGARSSSASMRAPLGEILAEMPARALRASKVSAFDSNGDPIAVAPSGDASGLETRLQNALDAADGAGMVAYSQARAYAAGTVGDKLREMVSVLDFGADPTGATDSTAAFTAAQAAADTIDIPPGTYLLDEFKQATAKVFRGAGLNNTFIKQANAGRPAWWCVSKAVVYPTQIVGAKLSGVWFLGAAGATVASCIVEAAAPYVVAYSEFDIGGSGGYHTLKIITGTAFEVYSSKFSVYQDNHDGRGGSVVGSTNTGVVLKGVYNEYFLNIAKAANGIGVEDDGWNGVFRHVVTEGQQIYRGANNVLVGPSVEFWYGTAQSSAFSLLGANNTALNACIVNVPRGKITNAGIELNNGGGNATAIYGYRVLGQDGALTFTGALVGATSATLTAAWAQDTGAYWVTFSDSSRRLVILTNGATSATWSGAVTATASATVVYNTPQYPMSIPAGNSGTIVDATVGDCQYKLEEYVSDTILDRFTISGNSGGLARRGKLVPVGASADRGDASVTLVAGTDRPTQRFATTLTANRTVTLSTTDAANGDKFRIVRTGLGAFTLDVGGLKTIPSATAAWVDVEYNGSAWVLAGYGAL